MAIFTKANINSEDSNQRLKAVEKLDSQLDKPLLLNILLEDKEIKVKEAALSKLSDPELLAENLANFSTNMQMATCARIVALLQIDLLDEKIKKSTLEKVADLLNKIEYQPKDEKIPPNILITFIFDSLLKDYENIKLNLFIIELVKSLKFSEEELQAWFTKIAVSNSSQDVRLKALTYISDEESLEKVLNCAKKYKKVKKTAQEKLQKLKKERLENEEFQEKCHRLALAARELSLSPYDKLFTNRFEYLQKSWLEVSFKASFKDKELFESCMQDIQARISAEEQIQFAAAEAQQHLEKTQKCLESSQELLKEVLSLEKIKQSQLNSILAKTKELEEEYRLLPNSDLTLTQKFNENIAKLQKSIQVLEIFSEKKSEFEKYLKDTKPESLSKAEDILLDLNFDLKKLIPTKIALNKLEGLKKKSKISPEEPIKTPDKHEITTLNKNLNLLNKSLQEGQLKTALKTANDIRSFFKNYPNYRLTRQEQRFRNLNRRLFELKKWQDSIAEPKRIEICEALEFLAEDEQMNLKLKANKIKQLQKNWRELGSDGQSKSLWNRYKKAADRAYAPCKEQINTQIEQKNFNAKQKTTICDELELLLEQDFFLIKTQDYYHIIGEAKKQWRFYSPVSAKDYKKLHSRYLKLLDELTKKRNFVNKKIRAQKLGILDKSQDLLKSNDAKLEDFKSLKRAWFEIDLLPLKEERQKYAILTKRIGEFFARNQSLRDQELKQQKQEEKRLSKLAEILTKKPDKQNLADFNSNYKEFMLLFRDANSKIKRSMQKTQVALKEKFEKIELWTAFLANKAINPPIITKEVLEASDILARLKVITGTANKHKSEVLKLQIARLQQRKNLHIKDDFTEVCLLIYMWQNLDESQKIQAEKEQLAEALENYCLA